MSDLEHAPAAPDLVVLSGKLVEAYVANNAVQKADIPALIAIVHAAFAGLGKPQVTEPEKPTPAVSVRKSITDEYLISLEDGRRYKTLKRHLARLGLTPEQYRAKWDLPANYPMTSPDYSKRRSQLALDRGLGRVASKKKPPATKRQKAAPRKRSK